MAEGEPPGSALWHTRAGGRAGNDSGGLRGARWEQEPPLTAENRSMRRARCTTAGTDIACYMSSVACCTLRVCCMLRVACCMLHCCMSCDAAVACCMLHCCMSCDAAVACRMSYVVYCVVYSVCGEPKLCAPCHSAEVRTEARMGTGECMAPLRSEHGAVVMHRRARALRPEDERRACLHRIAPIGESTPHSQSIGAPCSPHIAIFGRKRWFLLPPSAS